jgi:hypothetical protein
MADARISQQEKANVIAMEAKKNREMKERERKLAHAVERRKSEEKDGGRRLGGGKPTNRTTSSSSATCGYNPMDPSSGSSTGPRYR